MGTDCEVLSPNARKIFELLKPYFPPDPWQKPRWNEEGIIEDENNGRLDLRKHGDRQKLLERTRFTIGSLVETVAGVYKKEKGNSLDGFENHRFGKMVKHKVELLQILTDLDFQIETLDLVED